MDTTEYIEYQTFNTTSFTKKQIYMKEKLVFMPTAISLAMMCIYLWYLIHVKLGLKSNMFLSNICIIKGVEAFWVPCWSSETKLMRLLYVLKYR